VLYGEAAQYIERVEAALLTVGIAVEIAFLADTAVAP
jgi:hypothetical protein